MNNKMFNADAIREYYLRIIEKLPGHIYWKNRNGVILGCNTKQAQSVGLNSAKDMIGLTAYDTLTKQQADEITKIDNRVMATGQPYRVEEVSRIAEGIDKIYYSEKVPLYDDDDKKIIGVLGISVDITPQKEAERLKIEHSKTEQAKIEAERYAARMKEIATTVAHEMRTPLSSINNRALGLNKILSILLEGYHAANQAGLVTKPLPASVEPLLQTLVTDINDEVKSAFIFIDMLLTNIQAGQFDTTKFIDLSIQTVINEAISQYSLSAQQRKLIHVNIHNDFIFHGDMELMKHIIFNLLKNAIYYIAASHKGKIDIWTELKPTHNELYFKDTAKGIAPDILDHIFEPFFTKTYHGTGIGLSFCKNVMKSFGGDISCNSIENEFTEFVLVFPKI